MTRNLLVLVALLGAVHGPFTPADRHRNSYPDAVVPEPADIYPDQPTRKETQICESEIAGFATAMAMPSWIQVKQRTVKNAPIHGNTLQNWVRQYQGVLAIDDSVGRLREALEKSGQLNNT